MYVFHFADVGLEKYRLRSLSRLIPNFPIKCLIVIYLTQNSSISIPESAPFLAVLKFAAQQVWLFPIPEY